MPILFAKVKNKKKKKDKSGKASSMTLREIFNGRRKNEVKAIGCWALSLLMAAALWPHAADHNLIGPTGEVIFRLGFALMGILVYLLPVATALYGLILFKEADVERKTFKLLGLVLTLLAIAIIVELVHPEPVAFDMVKSFYRWDGAENFWAKFPASMQLWYAVTIPAGGIIADASATLLRTIFSTIGTYIICGTVLIISLYLLELEPYALRLIKRFKDKMMEAAVKAKDESKKSFNYAKPEVKNNKKELKVNADKMEDQEAAIREKPRIKIAKMPEPAIEVKTRTKEEPKEEPAPTSLAVVEADKHYQLPELDLLENPIAAAGLTSDYFENMSKTLETALGQFGVEAKVVEVCPGPVVTRYELEPSPGVKVNRIISLSDDIALAMRAAHVRIEAPIPGKGAVGIEVPNREKQIVVIKELLASEAFKNHDALLTFAVGKDIGGELIFGELNGMPHLLIAGATGSGKSACINGIISSILYRAKPNQVKFLMVDPKRVELTTYNGIPHLLSPVITDSREAAGALRLVVREMEDRYKRLAELGVRDINHYNQRVAEEQMEIAEKQAALEEGQEPPKAILTFMPYIVIFIDELADLMMVAANEVETTIARLAQMARAVGIHMVLATQRPSVDVITGVIKANFPSRIAFQVSSKVDSRTILDANGADALLGKGDMLYSLASLNKPLRVQGVFITTKEVDRIVRFWKKQGAPVFDEAFSQEKLKSTAGGNGNGGGSDESDELYEQAVMWVMRAKQASTSMLQRRLKIGYSRAARLVDLMEENGVVGPPEGSKPRKVLIEDDMGYAADDPQGV